MGHAFPPSCVLTRWLDYPHWTEGETKALCREKSKGGSPDSKGCQIQGPDSKTLFLPHYTVFHISWGAVPHPIPHQHLHTSGQERPGLRLRQQLQEGLEFFCAPKHFSKGFLIFLNPKNRHRYLYFGTSSWRKRAIVQVNLLCYKRTSGL